MKKARLDYLTALMFVLALSGCASQPKNQIMLMPAPDVFDQGDWDPFTDRDPIKDIPYGGILCHRPRTGPGGGAILFG